MRGGRDREEARRCTVQEGFDSPDRVATAAGGVVCLALHVCDSLAQARAPVVVACSQFEGRQRKAEILTVQDLEAFVPSLDVVSKGALPQLVQDVMVAYGRW